MIPWFTISVLSEEESLLEHLDSLQPQPGPHCAPDPLHSHLLVLHAEAFEHEQPSDGTSLGKLHFSSVGFSGSAFSCLFWQTRLGDTVRRCFLAFLVDLTNSTSNSSFTNSTSDS